MGSLCISLMQWEVENHWLPTGGAVEGDLEKNRLQVRTGDENLMWLESVQ